MVEPIAHYHITTQNKQYRHAQLDIAWLQKLNSNPNKKNKKNIFKGSPTVSATARGGRGNVK